MARASLVAASLLCTAGIPAAQEYPARPIEFIVPWGPGGGADQLARKLGRLLEARLKVSMPIVNVPGATGQTGLTKLLTAPADGYSIAVFVGPTFALLAGTPLPKWTMRDMEQLGIVIQQTSAFLVAEGGRFKTWTDLEKAARTERLRVAITGFGSDDDLAVNFLANKGYHLASLPMPKPGERYAAILGGHAEVLYEQIGDVRSFVEGKLMKPIVFFSEKRDVSFPDVPTAAEVGHKVSLPQFRSIIVRSGTDARIVTKLTEALADAVRDPEYVAFLKHEYAAPDSFVPAAGAGVFLENLLKGMKELVASSGVTPDPAGTEPRK